MQRTKKYVGSEAPDRGVRGVRRGRGRQSKHGGFWRQAGAPLIMNTAPRTTPRLVRGLCAAAVPCGGATARTALRNRCETGATDKYWVTGKKKCSRVWRLR